MKQETKALSREQIIQAALLQTSPTLLKSARFMQDFPSEPPFSDEIMTCLLTLVKEHDAGNVKFESVEASAMFHGIVGMIVTERIGRIELEEVTKQ